MDEKKKDIEGKLSDEDLDNVVGGHNYNDAFVTAESAYGLDFDGGSLGGSDAAAYFSAIKTELQLSTGPDGDGHLSKNEISSLSAKGNSLLRSGDLPSSAGW